MLTMVILRRTDRVIDAFIINIKKKLTQETIKCK